MCIPISTHTQHTHVCFECMFVSGNESSFNRISSTVDDLWSWLVGERRKKNLHVMIHLIWISSTIMPVHCYSRLSKRTVKIINELYCICVYAINWTQYDNAVFISILYTHWFCRKNVVIQHQYCSTVNLTLQPIE